MPSPDFFRKQGLFVLDEFFDPAFCSQLRSEMRSARRAEKGVVNNPEQYAVLDENIRKVLVVDPEEATHRLVHERLVALKPQMEEYFQLPLGDCEKPQYLMYNEGAFFKPHTDVGDLPEVSG